MIRKTFVRNPVTGILVVIFGLMAFTFAMLVFCGAVWLWLAVGDGLLFVAMLFGAAMVGASCYMLLLGVQYAIPALNFLDLGEEGFSYRTEIFRTRHDWAGSGDFAVVERRRLIFWRRRFIAYNRPDAHGFRPALNRWRWGYDFLFPCVYAIGAQQLAEEMNARRRHKLTTMLTDPQSFAGEPQGMSARSLPQRQHIGGNRHDPHGAQSNPQNAASQNANSLKSGSTTSQGESLLNRL